MCGKGCGRPQPAAAEPELDDGVADEPEPLEPEPLDPEPLEPEPDPVEPEPELLVASDDVFVVPLPEELPESDEAGLVDEVDPRLSVL